MISSRFLVHRLGGLSASEKATARCYEVGQAITGDRSGRCPVPISFAI